MYLQKEKLTSCLLNVSVKRDRYLRVQLKPDETVAYSFTFCQGTAKFECDQNVISVFFSFSEWACFK